MILKNVFCILFFVIYIDNCMEVCVEYDPLTNQLNYNSQNYSTYSNDFIQIPPDFRSKNEKHGELTSSQFWFFVFVSFCLTMTSGLMSGLTVGYLSIDDLIMELKMTTGTDEEKRQADLVLPILAKRHWLLVTLLLCNAAAMEALPLFLDRLMPEFAAIMVSVTLVLIFGEVVPQAICTGPDQVRIAAMVAPLTRALMWITCPISYPIAKGLDKLLGEHSKNRFMNNDLKALIELHTENSLKKLHEEEGHDGENDEKEHDLGLNEDQANIITSTIGMKKTTAIEIMIPTKSTYMINYDMVLNNIQLQLILEKGYSRIPVYENDNKNDVIGLLRIKQLIGIDTNQNKSLRQLGLKLKKPIVINPKIGLFDLLKEFRKGKSHMAFITENVKDMQMKLGLDGSNSACASLDTKFLEQKKTNLLGIITIEDVIEKTFNIEILDEDDYEKKNSKRRDSNSKKVIGKKTNTKEIAGTLLKDKGEKIHSLYTDSFKKSILTKGHELDYYGSKKENFIV